MGYRNPEVNTPNLDRLVASGTTFHRAYTPNPTCTPARASWITGLYPSQHGAYSLGTKLMEDVPTIGDHLKDQGCTSALVGKAHFQPLQTREEYPSIESYPIMHDLDYWRGFDGPFYGFDHVELARNHTDESHVGQHYALWMQEKGYTNWRDYFLPTPPALTTPDDKIATSTRTKKKTAGEPWNIPKEIHYNTWIAERTNALMDRFQHEGKRFMLWASFFDPHPQYMVPEPYASMYNPDRVTVPEHTEGEFDDKPPYFARCLEASPDFSDFVEPEGNSIHGAGSHRSSPDTKAKNIATMYGMMTMLDDAVGQILDHLAEIGLTRDTLVCFTTDHGDLLGQHGLTAKAIHHYEDLLRVPLVISQPGSVPAGVVSESLQSTVDLAPTFLRMMDLPLPRTMSGLDESPVWRGEKDTIRDHVIVENQHQPTTMNMRTYVTDRYKLTVHYRREYGELYDLKNDPGELVNHWDNDNYRAVKNDLLLHFLYGEMQKAVLPMPRIAGA